MKLKDTARDVITGFTGTVTAMAQYLDQMDQFYLEGLTNTGEPHGQWYSRSRLKLISTTKKDA